MSSPGTSAGGINGIYLTKAIAHNLSQDALRDLWFERGDMNQLLTAAAWLPVKLRFFLLLPSALKRRRSAATRWRAGCSRRSRGWTTAAASRRASTRSFPQDSRLDLFVTITDFYGYDRQVPIFDPRSCTTSGTATRWRSRICSGGRATSSGRRNNGSLAFAARTTSCFPGVFPPVSIADFRKWVPEANLDDLRRCFRGYGLAGAAPENTYFVDGGVLDNKPFGWAIDAIKHQARGRRGRTAAPVPRARSGRVSGRCRRAARAAPGTLEAAIGAVSGLPAHGADPRRPARRQGAQRARRTGSAT